MEWGDCLPAFLDDYHRVFRDDCHLVFPVYCLPAFRADYRRVCRADCLPEDYLDDTAGGCSRADEFRGDRADDNLADGSANRHRIRAGCATGSVAGGTRVGQGGRDWVPILPNNRGCNMRDGRSSSIPSHPIPRAGC